MYILYAGDLNACGIFCEILRSTAKLNARHIPTKPTKLVSNIVSFKLVLPLIGLGANHLLKFTKYNSYFQLTSVQPDGMISVIDNVKETEK